MPSPWTKEGRRPKDIDKIIKRGESVPEEELIGRIMRVRGWSLHQRHDAKAQITAWRCELRLSLWEGVYTRLERDPEPRKQSKPEPPKTKLVTFASSVTKKIRTEDGFEYVAEREVPSRELDWPPRPDQQPEPTPVPEGCEFWLFHEQGSPVTASQLPSRPVVRSGERHPITAAEAALIGEGHCIWRLAPIEQAVTA